MEHAGEAAVLTLRLRGKSAVNGERIFHLPYNGLRFIPSELKNAALGESIQYSTRPVNSPQSTGIAESFMNTFKPDYIGGMGHTSCTTAQAQLPDVSGHFNEVHLHSALGYKSPRIFRKERRRQALGTVAK